MGDREKKTQIEEKKILHNDLTVRLPDWVGAAGWVARGFLNFTLNETSTGG
jgi:hypothetical protein